MEKVMLVFGTRPEAIKMCPLVNELKSRPGEFETVVCVTGQHREMLEQVLRVFGVEPDHDLAIMKPGQTLFDVTCDVLLKLKAVLEAERPDVVLVHGDTTTSFAAALACFYLQIPVGHVEAGLRTRDIYSPWPEEFNRVVLVHGDTTTSFAAALACFYLQIPVGHVEAGLRTRDIYSPWPEEFNRQAVDIVSGYYFAPTEASRRNLLDEGKPAERIWVTGNTGIDALATTVREGYSHPELEWARGSRLILVTAHRRENLGEPMHRMFRAIRRVMEEHPDTKAVYPVHMNPLVRKAAHEELDGFDRLRIVEPLEVLDFHNFMAASHLILTDSGGIQEEAPGKAAHEELDGFDRLRIVEPLEVLDFHNFMAASHLILTDSGGIQEEAPGLGKPVLVMRDTTERPEGVEAGTLKLVGTDEDVIYREFSRLLSDADEYARMSRASNPYGDGHASERIADVLAG